MRDKAINIVKSKGPLLPAQLAKEIGTNILMASAYLSELVASKVIKISNIKVGGSPLYYAHGQEGQLQRFADNLNEKEKMAYELLKENKVLRDNSLTPLMRVALREIKDFAIPLQITHNDKVEIFWKWYIASEQDVDGIIKKHLGEEKQEKTGEKAVAGEQAVKERELEENRQDTAVEKRDTAVAQQKILKEAKEQIKEKPKEKQKREFLDTLIKFFEKNNIKIIESLVLKKSSEIDFVVEIPSPIGNLSYYCKAKNKNRINDLDLSNAYVKGQMRKLPVLFLSAGELTKKGIELLENVKGLSFKKIN